MKLKALLPLFLLNACCRFSPPAPASRNEAVILMHGLIRSARAMERLETRLEAAGYQVENVDYPSRSAEIPELSARYLSPVVARVRAAEPSRIHFVGHSMGGILIRSWLADHALPEGGKVVMLSPPNGGSEIVDRLGHWRSFRWINGPASLQLHTGADSFPLSLPPPDYPLAVFTGQRSINPILSLLIPGPNDGKVSIERAKVPGMALYKIFPVSHPFIMRDEAVLDAVLAFLAD